MKKIVEIYRDLLPAFGLAADSENKIFIGGGELGLVHPLEIDGKNIYIPTDEFLKNSNYRDQIALHPLIENSLKGPAPILIILQEALTNHLFASGSTIIEALLNACAKQKNGEEISSPKLLSYVAGNEGADEKTKSFFKGLVSVMEKDTSKKLFSVYLKFGGKVNGMEVSRQCSITSPLLEALERAHAIGIAKSGPASVWNVEAPRKKDIELLINVIKSAFPLLEEKGYTKGSVSKIAPYCEALFDATLAINQDIVAVAKALIKQDPVNSLASYLMVNLEGLNEILATTSEWDIYRNSIMKTAYNEGGEWNTVKDRTGGESEYKIVKEASDVEPDPVAITKTLIINSVKPTPGTRQPLVTLPEEELRSMEHSTTRGYGSREVRKGFDDRDRGGSSRFGSRNVEPRDMTFNELRDAIDDLKEEIREIDRYGSRDEVAGIRDLERYLDDLIYERKQRDREADRDDRGRDRGGRDRDNRRPVPRVIEKQRYGDRRDRNDRNDRNDRDRNRFGNRNW